MIGRRKTLALLTGAASFPQLSFAASAREIMWEDLIPPGVPYSEIIGEGELDEANDFWNPVYDANGIKLNEQLNGVYIKMPGFIVPFDVSAKGVTDFMLVPYLGACIHTPPPPANQLVVVNSKQAWPGDQLWDAVWVTGLMRTKLQKTDLGQTGYSLSADSIEIYQW